MISAENIVKKWNITRAEQDSFAVKSQQKVEESQKSGHFDQEIVPVLVPGRKGPTEVKVDEFPRAGTTVEALARLKPCFITVSVSIGLYLPGMIVISSQNPYLLALR